MQDNTPPRVPELEDEDDEGELIQFDNDEPPDDDDLLEMQEITLQELEARLQGSDDDDSSNEGSRRPRREVEDMAQLTFGLHGGPVFSCALHPQNVEWAVTGGEDDRAFIWHTQTGEKLFELTEHNDTVTEVHFSYDGNYLVSADMAGEIFVYKLKTDEANKLTMSKVWEYSMGDMAWLKWHRAANVLFAGSDNGEVYIWRIPSGDCKILPGQGERCEAGELTMDGKKLFTSYTNGVLKLWDLKNCIVLMEVDKQHPMAHQEVATTVACDKESPLYMSGGQDGKILFCTINGPVAAVEASGPVECVEFAPSTALKTAASGTLHGQIAFWDFAKYALRNVCELPEPHDGVSKMKWLSDYTLLVCTIQGNIYAYDARTGTCKFSLTGHWADVYDFCYNPHESILLTVSEDNFAKIFKVPQLGD